MKVSDWKIGARLGASFTLVVLLMIVVAVVGVTRIESMNHATNVIVEDRYPKVDMTRDIRDNVMEFVLASYHMLATDSPEEIKKDIELIAKKRQENSEIFPKLEKMINTDVGRAAFKKVVDTRTAYGAAVDRYVKLVQEGKKEEARKYLLTDVYTLRAPLMAAINDFIKLQEGLMKKADQESNEIYAMARLVLIAMSVIAAIIAAVAALLATRSITRPISDAVKVAETVAGGDLTSRIDVRSKDETGQLMQALKNMNDNLLDIVTRVRTGTDTIATASAQIAAGNQDLSSRTEEQASSLEETASSMEELTSTVRQNADNARQANQLAVTASDVAVKGGEVVSQVVETMGAINDSSHKMADIINVIDGIAFQTNILALNAAVEAARAGEQGRGFAVVATEVRSLAQRSASAAREIKTLIDDSVEKVEAGSKLVEQAGSTMDEVVSSIKQVHDIMSEITAASQEQSDGIEQVNQAVSQMDQVTQQNAALVEEAAAAAESLQDQAANLVEAVSVFKTGTGTVVVATKRQQAGSKPAANLKLVTQPKLAAKPAAKALAAPSSAPKLAPPKAEAGKEGDWEEF